MALISADGRTLLTVGAAAAELPPALSELAREAVRTGGRVVSQDGLGVAEPSRFGSDAQVAGTVVTHWSVDHMMADIAAANRESVLIAAALFAGLLAAAALVLRQTVSQPLRRVGQAMAGIAGGAYATPVPGLGRRDEIGGIARALDDLRAQLDAAQDATREALFKGAGFEGCSAALMLTDAAGRIRSANPAALSLVGEVFGLPAADLMSREAEALAPALDGLGDRLRSGKGETIRYDFDVSTRQIAVVVNAVRGPDGVLAGAVLEWADVTASRMGTALLDALNANQALAEFTTDGRLSACNAIFAAMQGSDSDALTGSHHADIVARASSGTDLPTHFATGRPAIGQFVLTSGPDRRATLDGGLFPVTDMQGRPFRFFLLGKDVTSAVAERARAEAEQARMTSDQRTVVEALGLGLSRLSDGDLAVTIDTPFSPDYEQLRHDFNAAASNLDTAMAAVLENAQSIRGEAAEISTAADDLSRRTEHQAATLEQTAAALAEITASVGSAAAGARKANTIVIEARANAEQSGGVVQEAVTAMSEIEASSTKISKIISVIDDIAFQTNLLALNAGVEAARAGDAGRGFAVVASEVRALAQRSSNAAREINALISTSGRHVSRGVTLVGDAGAALQRIVASVSDISEHVGTIAASAQEQAAGLEQINGAMSQLDQVTQQNAAMFEETTAASHALTQEAETLSRTTARFRISAATSSIVAGAFQSKRAGPPLSAHPKPQATPKRAAVSAGSATPPAMAEADEGDWEDF